MQLQHGGKIPHIDFELMRLQLRLTPGQRILAMLERHELIVAAMRARLRQERPELSDREIGLLIIEEFERDKGHEFQIGSLFLGEEAEQHRETE